MALTNSKIILKVNHTSWRSQSEKIFVGLGVILFDVSSCTNFFSYLKHFFVKKILPFFRFKRVNNVENVQNGLILSSVTMKREHLRVAVRLIYYVK